MGKVLCSLIWEQWHACINCRAHRFPWKGIKAEGPQVCGVSGSTGHEAVPSFGVGGPETYSRKIGLEGLREEGWTQESRFLLDDVFAL